MSTVAPRDSPGLPSPAAAAAAEQKPPASLKPCCACPETKRARDAWWVTGAGRGLPCGDLNGTQIATIHSFGGRNIIEKGEEHCGALIEAHKECMRALGFKI
uniref:Cytochrome c oxidase copper chaperone COX17 n=1 Tax=Podarcis muralis TaxID=64176 RepID=A0A670JM07_PODMU